MNLKESRKQMIKEIADNIKKELEGGNLFFDTIDMNDVDELIVGTYYITTLKELGLLVRKDSENG